MIDERTEQLISRKLDGELDEDTALELNKRLIRSPQARALLEDYERNDVLAAGALSNLMSCGNLTASDRFPMPQTRWDRFGTGARAIAAALLLMAAVGGPIHWSTRSAPMRAGQEPPVVAATMANAAPTPRFSPLESPRAEDLQLQRNVLGVWDDETQSVYVLELDRHAQTVVPVAMNF